MATEVVVLGEVESNTLPPPNNPDYSASQTHTSAIATTTKSTLAVASGAAVAQATSSMVATNNRARMKLRTNLGRQPFGIQCPHCQRETITIVEDRIGVGTIIAAVMLAIFFWPLCWLPFCVPSCKRTYHFCGHDPCRKRIGITHVCA